MRRITLDAPLASKLRRCRDAVALCDATGGIIGRFFPEKALQPQISEAEIQRRLKQKGGRTLRAILNDLEETA